MMKFMLDVKSIKFKMWKYFMLFAALIMLVLWFLQIIFLNSYYQAMKTREVLRAANTLMSEYEKGDFDEVVSQYSFKNNMFILITDLNGYPLYSSGTSLRGTQGGKMIMEGHEKGFGGLSIREYYSVTQQLMQGNKDRIYYKISSPSGNMQMMVYGSLIKTNGVNQAILYITSPLDPIDSTTAILKNQLIIVTFILLILAFIISFFISKKLSKPIEDLTASAKKLAEGDYNVMFGKGSFSEMTELSNTLNYATRELLKTEQLRKELIANISHDLRTPLTMIKMYGEMIRDLSGNNSKKRSEHIDIIIDETNRLSGLVNDILDLSKIESGTAQMQYERLDLSDLVKGIIERFKVLSEFQGYTFNLECDQNAFISADKKRLEQVIYNLISNAVNYTGDDKQVILRVKDLGEKVRFEVTDTGDGIPKDKLETIWDRYYKGNETHKRAVVGTGIGLSIVKNILKAHSAEFGVNSTLGEGSTFWFQYKHE